MDRFPHIAAEVPKSFESGRSTLDDKDLDPFVVGNKHKKGRTHTPRPGNSSTQTWTMLPTPMMILSSSRYFTRFL